MLALALALALVALLVLALVALLVLALGERCVPAPLRLAPCAIRERGSAGGRRRGRRAAAARGCAAPCVRLRRAWSCAALTERCADRRAMDSPPASTTSGSPPSTALTVPNGGPADDDLLNPAEPYQIGEEFFDLLEKKAGNNFYQCRGSCGPGGCGLKGAWPRLRLFAHITRTPGHHVTLCTSGPKTLRGRDVDATTMRKIATKMFNEYRVEQQRLKEKKRRALAAGTSLTCLASLYVSSPSRWALVRSNAATR